MQEDRRDAAEADEDGGGGDEKYEIDSMGKPVRTGKGDALRRSVGSGDKGRDGIATYRTRKNKNKLWANTN